MQLNKGIKLQIGVYPAMYLSAFSISNEEYAKNKALHRTVVQYADDY